MPDWPVATRVTTSGDRGVISTMDPLHSDVGNMALLRGFANTSNAWPSANLAEYIPVLVEVPVVAYQMSTVNGSTTAGTTHVGIYTEKGVQLVTTSAAQAGVSTIQSFDITDTELAPGVYYLALANTSGTATFLQSSCAAALQRVCGVREQASAVPLPNPATFAVTTRTIFPAIVVHTRATTP